MIDAAATVPEPGGSPMRKYVIIHLNLFTPYDWDRFGCELFAENGFDVVPIELLIGYDGDETSLASGGFRSIPQAVRITDRQALQDILKTVSEGDVVFSTIPFGPHLYWVYHDLAAFNVDYATLNFTAAEDHRMVWWGTAENLAELLEIKFVDYVSLARRFVHFLRRMANPTLGYWKAKAPTWWFRAGTSHSPLGSYFPKRRQAKLVKIYSWNYELALRESSNTAELFPGQHQGKYIVYLDQTITGHPDSNILHNRNLNFRGGPTEENFSRSVRRFFDRLEQQTGYTVVVAGSPKSRFDEENNLYGRRIIYGATPNLIKHSAFALATTTSAAEYGVIFERPVMIFTTDEVERQHYFKGSAIRLASALGQRRVNIDRLQDGAAIPLPTINERAYQRYMRCYVKEADAPARTIWETVFEAMTGDKPETAPAAARQLR